MEFLFSADALINLEQAELDDVMEDESFKQAFKGDPDEQRKMDAVSWK